MIAKLFLFEKLQLGDKNLEYINCIKNYVLFVNNIVYL